MLKSIGAALTAACFIFVSGAACAAPGKPLADSDRAEVQVFSDKITSIVSDVNTAVNLATTDPAQSCTLMRGAEQHSTDLHTQVLAFRDRLVAEGKTTDGTDEMISGSSDMMNGAHKSAEAICSGKLNNTGDPQTDAILKKLMALTSNFTNAMAAAIKEEQQGDHTAACGHFRNADTAQAELYNYLVDLRHQVPNGSGDATQLDDTIAKVGAVKPQLTQNLARCPAA